MYRTPQNGGMLANGVHLHYGQVGPMMHTTCLGQQSPSGTSGIAETEEKQNKQSKLRNMPLSFVKILRNLSSFPRFYNILILYYTTMGWFFICRLTLCIVYKTSGSTRSTCKIYAKYMIQYF
jgi:hypothetical protein